MATIGQEGAREEAGGAFPGKKEILSKAKEKTLSLLDDQKKKATEGLEGLAGAFRHSADKVQEHQQVSKLTGLAADKLEEFAGLLREKEIGEILDEAERFLTRQPIVLLGGFLALGFLFGRFLKRPDEEMEEASRAYRSEPSAQGGSVP